MLLCTVARAETQPASDVPASAGKRYEALVPATLDLAERMKLSLNGLTRCVSEPPAKPFPPTQYPCQHFIQVSPWPKVLRTVLIYGKFMEATALARAATGSGENVHVDADWRRAWLAWARTNPIMHGPEGGRRLSWIAINHLREKDPAWAELGRRAVERLAANAVPHRDGAWLHPGMQISPADEGCPSAEASVASDEHLAALREANREEVCLGWNATFMSWTLQGLCQFHAATGDAAALELAGKLARYMKDYAGIFASDGRFLAGHPHDWPVVHFHHCFNTAAALLDFGIVSGRREYGDFARTVYAYVLTFCSREIGFAPEYCYGRFPRKQDCDNTEGCCSADLLMMAVRLTQAGGGDHWDDVDRFVRNHIAALQLTDTRWFYEIPENRKHGWRFPNPDIEAAVGPLVGNFGGWASVNEWHIPEAGPGIMTCCLGNCTRALYYTWEGMIDYVGRRLQVHLLLNRASPWADIDSHLPYTGRVDIRVKQPCDRISVRAPEWVSSGGKDITCTVESKSQPVAWRGRYVEVGAVTAGHTVTLTFPINVKRIDTKIGRRNYKLTIKGNTVIAIDPPGSRIPLYKRDHYHQDAAPMTRVRRHVEPNAPTIGYSSRP